MERRLDRLVRFLSFAFGGASKYDGRSMLAAHAPLVADRGLADAHLDAVVEQFRGALVDLRVDPALVAGTVAVTESVRDAVPGRLDDRPPAAP